MKPYYYVYKHCDQGPRVRHPSLQSAQTEAERLACQHPGEHFEILECLGVASTSKSSTFWMDGEEPMLKPKKSLYRSLDKNEEVLPGDQFFAGGMWRDAPGAGYIIGNYCPPHRRPL